jgi:hypothetical protein
MTKTGYAEDSWPSAYQPIPLVVPSRSRSARMSFFDFGHVVVGWLGDGAHGQWGTSYYRTIWFLRRERGFERERRRCYYWSRRPVVLAPREREFFISIFLGVSRSVFSCANKRGEMNSSSGWRHRHTDGLTLLWFSLILCMFFLSAVRLASQDMSHCSMSWPLSPAPAGLESCLPRHHGRRERYRTYMYDRHRHNTRSPANFRQLTKRTTEHNFHNQTFLKSVKVRIQWENYQ